MTSDFEFHFFEENDIGSLRRYYKSSTGLPFDHKRWDWQYTKNYAGRGDPFAYICTDSKSGEFVGCIHSTPTIIQYNGHNYYCTIGSDAYVRPEYRGRGVYNLIANFLLSYPEQLGSIRFSFYNRITKNTKSSAPIIMDTSVSLKILNEDKVSKSFFGDSLRGAIAPYLYKAIPTREKSDTDIVLRDGRLCEYADFYIKWSKDSDIIHTPRTKDYLEWRLINNPHGEAEFFSVWHNEILVGYFAVIIDDHFESYDLRTLVISDYLIQDNNPRLFGGAVSEIIEKHHDIDLVVSRPFASPEYQKRLMGMGFLDSMYFPLNKVIKPGSLGHRIYDERCRDFGEKKWYLTHADCF